MPDWPGGAYVGLGLVAGAALGVVVGAIAGSLPLWFIGGAALGLVAGSVAMLMNERR